MKCKCCCNKKTEQTENKPIENEQVEQSENLTDTAQEIQPVKKKNFFARHKKLVILISILFAIGLAIGIAAIVDGINGIKVLGDFVTDQILGMKWLNMLLGMAFTGMFGEEFMSTRWGRRNTIFYLRHNKDNGIAVPFNLSYIVYSKLFSARKNKKISRQISRHRRKRR